MRSELSSFRDPAGKVYTKDGEIYRAINASYRPNYEHLIGSGLYERLTRSNLLIPHQEIPCSNPDIYKLIKPEKLRFISYPYEWCFSQLQDAARLTLEIQKISLDFGMTLRDASAFNIQFRRGKPIMIDTLSFAKYNEGRPWSAYRQFCQHFFCPLALAADVDMRMIQMSRLHIDGIPLDLTSRILPLRSWLKGSRLLHIHLHAGNEGRDVREASRRDGRRFGLRAMQGLLASLDRAVGSLCLSGAKSWWGSYYQIHNYSVAAFEHKKKVVEGFLRKISPSLVLDLGANTGLFSEIAARAGAETIAAEMDPVAVELNYLRCRKAGEGNILPLVFNLSNPSPNIGWRNRERKTLAERGPVDLVMSLALIHHLAIANNYPLNSIAEFLAQLGNHLIIEFVPKEDAQVGRLLRFRQDIFDRYGENDFEEVFSNHFLIEEKQKLPESGRSIYLMKNKCAP